MINFRVNDKDLEHDVYELIKMFPNPKKEINLNIEADKNPDFSLKVFVNEKKEYEDIQLINEVNENQILIKRHYKRFIKNSLYKFLKSYFNIDLPWGSSTGVRPTRALYSLLEEGYSETEVREILKNEFCFMASKIDMCFEILKNQKGLINVKDDVNLYIHIPICPSRCVYCSFVSSDIKRCERYMQQYIENLIDELHYTLKLIDVKKIKSIYVGGGTPSILSPSQIDELLSVITFNVNEFTFECGRPETITQEKLQILKKHNVTRISINPQSFNDNTLISIGRNHTVQDVFNAYKLARHFDFVINMDLIAGLPNERFEDFVKSVNTAIELGADNITIHTLSIKNASILKFMGNATLCDGFEVEKMLNYAFSTLNKKEYQAYYLYRQKNMLGFFENVGFGKNKKFSKFNIDSMEDSSSIVACGAGGISKRLYLEENRIERSANVKQIWDYVDRIEEMKHRKYDLFNDL